MAQAHALALDDIFAGRRDVEQEIDEEVFEQVHFVDVEKSAVGAGEKAGLESLFAARERPLQIESADHAVFGRAEREVHDRHANEARMKLAVAHARAALLAKGTAIRLAIEAAASDGADGRKQRGQRAHRGGFAGPAVAEGQHAADRWIDCRYDQGKLQLVLSNDGGKRIYWAGHLRSSSAVWICMSSSAPSSAAKAVSQNQ